MTNHFTDMANSDLVIVCGGNPAENHPASMRHVLKAVDAGGKLLVIDPRFTRTAAVADYYFPLRSGSDITLYGAIINYLISNDLINEEYVVSYTNASYIIGDDYDFEDGMFAGWEEDENGKGAYNKKKWAYKIEEETEWDTAGAFSWVNDPGVPEFDTPKVPKIAKDETLQDPRCVYQLMKKHYSRYTPELVEKITGITPEQFHEIANLMAETRFDDKSATWLYAMGLTQHTYGSQNIRAISMIMLLLGNIGIAGGGINALRGEGNVQGSTDWGLLFNSLPSYLAAPSAKAHPTLRDYLEKTTNYAGYWSNRPKFFISMLKEYWGEYATLENDYAYDYLPKLGAKNYSFMMLFEAMHEGTIEGLFCWGQNPALGGPNGNFERNAMANLKYMVAIDLFMTDTAAFWNLPLTAGEDPKPEEIETEVYFLPACGHMEKEGTIANSGRLLQWRYQAVDPLGEAIDDGQIMTLIVDELKRLYNEEGGVCPEPITQLYWDYYKDENGHFSARKSAMSMNGYDTKTGKLLKNFTGLKADGSTACSGWIYGGYYNNDSENPADQPCGSRDKEDRTISGGEGGVKVFSYWGFAWPLNRRTLYNRASTIKATGKARNPKRMLVEWDPVKEVWNRNDVPDFAFQTAQPDGSFKGNPPEKVPGFFMNSELTARFFAPGLNDGPFPEHYEPIESPVKNLISGTQTNPAALVLESSKYGGPDKYPIIMTTIRVVEHWQTGASTRQSPWVAQSMPHMFCEVPVALAEEKGIKNGDKIEIFNNRGTIKVYAMVTDRIRPFVLEGKTYYQVAMPWHWGKIGIARGENANSVSPNYGDANSFIPESKAFLVDIRKAG